MTSVLLAIVVGLAQADAPCGSEMSGTYAEAIQEAGDTPVVIGGRSGRAELAAALGRIDVLLLLG